MEHFAVLVTGDKKRTSSVFSFSSRSEPEGVTSRRDLMPFTPTHILAIVPLAAFFRRLPMSALVIGSMCPDLPLFLPFWHEYDLMHSPPGVFFMCLPLSVIAFLLFQCFIKVPIASLLPNWTQVRLATCARPTMTLSPGFLLRVSVAIVIGAFTHILWDTFTHYGRAGTQMFPVLYETVTIVGQHIPGYKLFQYGSTFVGIPILALLCARWLRGNSPTPVNGLYPFGRRAKMVSAGILIAIPLLVTVHVFATPEGTTYEKIGFIVKSSGLFAMMALIAYSFLFHVATGGNYGNLDGCAAFTEPHGEGDPE